MLNRSTPTNIMAFLKRSSFCVVTGASRGLGKEIAVQLAHGWSQNDIEGDLVLLGRTEKDLETAKSEIESSSPGISVHIVLADLQDLSTLHEVFAKCSKVASDSTKKHEQYMIIHSAGTLCDITKPMIEQTDPMALQEQMALNFTSMSILTSLFLSHFTTGERLVINVSSLLAKVYWVSYAMYSATRAARNALIGVLAIENPNVRFLTYTPGPCLTSMFDYANSMSYSESVRDMHSGLREKGEALTCKQSITRLMKILADNNYHNAAVIDYYDK